MSQEIIQTFNDPRTYRAYCPDCGRRMKAVNDGDDPIRNGCGEIVAYTFFIEYECPACRDGCAISMYTWRWTD